MPRRNTGGRSPARPRPVPPPPPPDACPARCALPRTLHRPFAILKKKQNKTELGPVAAILIQHGRQPSGHGIPGRVLPVDFLSTILI